MAKKKKTFWNLLEDLKGDKVVWMITILLILISVVCIFSSSSRLLVGNQTRIDIVRSQLLTVVFGLVLIFLCYKIPDIKYIRMASVLGLPVSLILLILLTFRVQTPFIRAVNINSAWRILEAGPIQIHVFEVVKVAMIMYLSWAVARLKERGEQNNFKKKVLLLYIPFVAVFVMVLLGSNSSGLIIGLIMALTIIIGGGSIKDMLLLAASGIAVFALCFGIYKFSGGQVMKRFATLEGRFKKVDYESELENLKPGTAEYREVVDKLMQPLGAKIAVHEGGLLGKGPGQSTQRYMVPMMSEDYMYSFIIEEYGLLGAIAVLILYVSLLARGSIIVRNCGKDVFAKSAVAGLCLLITGQAFLHMLVNVDIGPMTGQTLPLISHGKSAFLCFCLAFGIILSISKLAVRKIEKETAAAAPLFEIDDSIKADLDDLDAWESME